MARFGFSKTLLFLSLLLSLAVTASAQNPAPTPLVIAPAAKQPLQVAGQTKLFCAGYVQRERLPKMPEIVGALEEQEQRTFADGDVVYINAGSRQGIEQGQSFQIIRPRGDLKGVHRNKHGFLGTFIQEVGQLQVFKVGENNSAAQITTSCGDMVLLGDLLTQIPHRESPLQRVEVNMDRFADPTGKQVGRLMMAKDSREMLTANDVVYVDLGGEDNVKAGDYLTIFRPLGTGNITRIDNEELARNRAGGFQSDRYQGGGFSNQAQRAKDSNEFFDAEGRYRYRPMTTRHVKRDRPSLPRKVVGEMVLIDVQKRTATAIITRVVGEVHTGDWVEIQ
ncbi:MAG TPA: hypothetical protein VLB87_11710 [Pyrinomonadaceae bacterium]|nr:hypothetical protein [Pyrinomonadaceae bacterium]